MTSPTSTAWIPPSGGSGPRRRGSARAELVFAVALLVYGVVVGACWRLFAPVIASRDGGSEDVVAHDVTLSLLAFVAGVAVGIAVLIRPGSRPPLRTAVAIVGSILAAGVAWVVGLLLGEPHVRAIGAPFVWPVTTAAVIFLGTLIPGVGRHVDQAAGYVPPAPPGPPTSYTFPTSTAE